VNRSRKALYLVHSASGGSEENKCEREEWGEDYSNTMLPRRKWQMRRRWRYKDGQVEEEALEKW